MLRSWPNFGWASLPPRRIMIAAILQLCGLCPFFPRKLPFQCNTCCRYRTLEFQPKSLPTTVLETTPETKHPTPDSSTAYPSCRTPHTEHRNIKSLVGKPSRTRLRVRTPPTVGRNCGVPCIRWDADASLYFANLTPSSS
jgi:hypothetical protein